MWTGERLKKSNKLSHSWCFFFFALCSIRSSSRSSFQSAAANRRAKKQKCGTRQHATKKKRTNFSFLFFYLAFDLKVCSWLIHLHPLLLLFLSLFSATISLTKLPILGGRMAQWIAFSLRTQRPRVQFSALPSRDLSITA